tara:strand:+ start:1032 stop:1256 length:225 start_codon:yes stop_codon:yes gene_type:complete
MKNFTKTYNVTPNELQKSALTRAFKVLAQYELLEGNSVEVTTTNFQGKILATLSSNGKALEQRVIGVKGGLILV